jgi:hypothetical protein
MSTTPPSSRIQTPPSDAVTRSGRARKPVDRSGYVDSGEIDDSQGSDEGDDDNISDDDFVEERKWKRSRSSEEDDDEGEDENSQVSFSTLPIGHMN